MLFKVFFVVIVLVIAILAAVHTYRSRWSVLDRLFLNRSNGAIVVFTVVAYAGAGVIILLDQLGLWPE